MDLDGAVVSLGKRLVVVGREYVGLEAVLLSGQTEVDNQLLCPAYAEVGMNEGYLLGSHLFNCYKLYIMVLCHITPISAHTITLKTYVIKHGSDLSIVIKYWCSYDDE